MTAATESEESYFRNLDQIQVLDIYERECQLKEQIEQHEAELRRLEIHRRAIIRKWTGGQSCES